MSEGVITLGLLCLALLARCATGTLLTTVQSHKEDRTKHRAIAETTLMRSDLAHQSSFRRNLAKELLSLSRIHSSGVSGSSSSGGNLSLSSSPLYAADNPSPSSGSLHLWQQCSHHQLSSIFANNSHCVGNFLATSMTDCIIIRVKCHTNSPVSLSPLVIRVG